MSLPAQVPPEAKGNGRPAAYVETTPGRLGGNLRVGYGSPGTPGGIAVICISGSFTPFLFPFPELGGPLALDPLDPSYQIFFFGLDGSGDGSVTVPLAATFLPAAAPPLFVHTVTFDTPTQWSVSKTARIDWMVPDSWEAATPMLTPRQLHTATALGGGPRDNETGVLICGGATGSFVVPQPIASAELFSPLVRSTTPLPNLALPRAQHRAVRLADGRVLITGGVTTGGVVTATCEFFDPATQTFAPAPSMLVQRAGHAMTLLGDGRVLVSGGVTDWQNAATNFIGALNTATAVAEVFDPVAGTWTLLPFMASPRLGHSQTLLPDGRVLVACGIRGGYGGSTAPTGQIPQYTSSCQIFDPTTDTFVATGSLLRTRSLPLGQAQTWTGRAFHGASVLPGGDVLLTGGFVAQVATGTLANDETIVVPWQHVWHVATGTWTEVAELPVAMAWHSHEPQGAGAIVGGGFSGALTNLDTTDRAYFTDGTTVTPLAPLPSGRGAASTTRLPDGTILLYGGGVWPNTLADGLIYAPN